MKLKIRPIPCLPIKILFECLNKVKVLRNRLKILLLMLSEFKRINLSLSLLKTLVIDLRSETKGSRFDSGCQLSAEVSSLQYSPG